MEERLNLQGVKLVCILPSCGSTTLPQAISSVLAQKVDFEFKLIIVDEGLNDENYEIAQEFAHKNSHIIVLIKSKEHSKKPHIMSKAFALLKGVKYFCFLKPNECYVYDKKFADAVEFLDTHKEHTSYVSNFTFDKAGKKSLSYELKEGFLDLDLNVYKSGKSLIVGTEVYRNVYFYEKIHQNFLEFTQKNYGEVLLTNDFQRIYHLYAGKARFINDVQSLCKVDEKAFSLTDFEQELHEAKLYYACAEFFANDKDYFLKVAKAHFDKALCGFRSNDEQYTIKNRDLILHCLKQFV